jgi:predicted nucleic acid-binding Zn ribbon protein
MALLIEQFIKEEGLSEGLRTVRIYKAWDEAVGDFFASHTTSKHFNKDVLYCTFDSSMVRNQLFLMQDHILEKINNQMGDKVVSRLVFR